jgi:hypothetical protein
MGQSVSCDNVVGHSGVVGPGFEHPSVILMCDFPRGLKRSVGGVPFFLARFDMEFETPCAVGIAADWANLSDRH